MINIRTIQKLTDGDGFTLKNGKLVNYKSGYQVATDGVECRTARAAINSVKHYGGSCGVWFSDGIYYVDHSKRVSTKRDAFAIGYACNQQSILRWRDKSLIWLD